MWFVPDVKTVSADLLQEIWLCAHLVALHRRCEERGHPSETEGGRRSCSLVQDCLGSFSGDEWGRETVMACYQRAFDDALSLDLASLRLACGIGAGPDC